MNELIEKIKTYNPEKPMLLHMKNGDVLTVDTKHLFNNQYNVIENNKRIFDRDILYIENDARFGVVTCGYCGKQYRKKEDLLKHYDEVESKTCEGCFWLSKKLLDVKIEKTELGKQTIDADTGKKVVTTYIETKSYIYDTEHCRYNEKMASYENRANCSNFEHRKMKYIEFTPDNTFFLKYPAIKEFYNIDINKLIDKGFEKYGSFMIIYPKKIGSYTLEIYLNSSGMFENFNLYNSRNSIRFFVYDNTMICRDGFGYKIYDENNTFLPAKVYKKVMQICND